MKKIISFITLALLLSTTMASAAPDPMRMDSNKDGKISRDEASGRLEKHFDKLDTNGDGVITQAELDGAKTKIQAARGISEMDKNSDGKISRDEASGRLEKHFDKLDSNGDGFLSTDEMKAAREKRGERNR